MNHFRLHKNAKILLAGSAVWYFGEGMLGPLFAVFAGRVGGDIFEITWAWAAYLAVYGMLSILAGRFSDGSNKEKIMIVGYGLNAVATFGYLLVYNPFSLLVVQGVLGIARALATPTWDALYDQSSGTQKATNWGLADGIPALVTAAAVIAGGFIVSRYPFAMLFILMGIVQVIATFVQAKIFLGKRK